ncbi:hypothetical protein KAX29_05910 [candidate division WOR-3 bacterium]|nr:hypothetical protein [candidate division WOR-3 bacterium]
MTLENKQVTKDANILEPAVEACYKNGWQELWRHFLELLLIVIISFAISLPTWGSYIFEGMESIRSLFLIFLCISYGLFTFVYSIMLLNPIKYGVAFAYLKASRGDRLEVKDMFDVFKNYWNAVLANLLVSVIIGVGFVFLIVPGIILACKLAFVPYLIVDRKMDVIKAVKESWFLTDGHAWKVFLIALLGIPIAIVGLLLFGIGIIIAVMWIGLAFASLYHAVSMVGETSG